MNLLSFIFLLLVIFLHTLLFQIRVKHMISQGGVDQSPMATGYNRVPSSGRILETNTENLLRMVLNVNIPIFTF